MRKETCFCLPLAVLLIGIAVHPAMAIYVDGDLSDWDPSMKVGTHPQGHYDVYLSAEADVLLLGLDFPNDTTDAREGSGPNDMISVNIGRSGDGLSHAVLCLWHAMDAHPGEPNEVVLDGYYAQWREWDGNPLDPYWGPQFSAVPFPDWILAKTVFNPNRTTEWAIPMVLIGAESGENIYVQVFTATDVDGQIVSPWPSIPEEGPFLDETIGLSVVVAGSGWDVATPAEAHSAYGQGAEKGSKVINILALLLAPMGAVVVSRSLRKRR